MSLGRPRKRPPTATIETGHLPAPSGVNLVDVASQLPAEDCISLTNMFRGEYGLRTRSGYRDHVTGLDGAVRSVLPFRGSVEAEDRLFACTATGIWGCSDATAAPTQTFTFATSSGTSGLGIFRSFTNAAGAHFGLYTDEANGYHVYTEATDTWAAVAMGGGGSEVSGIDPATFAFVTSFKSRLWFVQRDSQTAWYLGTNALYGAATAFHFGAQFKAGGHLVGLWSWTVDGGAGMDDQLVAISSAGDVVVYKGTDPSSVSTFSIVGTWSVGAVPAGRRIATDHGGDLLILSSRGVVPLSKVLAGSAFQDSDIYATRKIAPVLGRLMTERGDSIGWEIRIHPEDKTLVVNTPAVSGADDEQWSMTLAARGWNRNVGLPMSCAETWRGKFYFGTEDARLCINDGDVDNNGIASSANAVAIEWSLVSSFQNLGNARSKRLQMVKPLFRTDGTPPQYSVEGRFNFDTSEPTGVTYASSSAGLWDSGSWDSMLWGSGEGTAGEYRGVVGVGSNVAVALKGSSQARTTLVGFDIMFDQGGAGW